MNTLHNRDFSLLPFVRYSFYIKKYSNSFENPVICGKGEERIIIWHSSFIKDNKKKIIGLLCSGEDITEQRKAATKLKESEENYRTLVDNIYQVAFDVKFDKNLKKK
ncbi:MAG: hypothetical protein ABI480_18905, partial [Chitinophagaceae bacterium]